MKVHKFYEIDSPEEFESLFKNGKFQEYTSFAVTIKDFLSLKENGFILDSGINRDANESRFNMGKFNATTEFIHDQIVKTNKQNEMEDFPYLPIYVCFTKDREKLMIVDGGHRSKAYQFYDNINSFLSLNPSKSYSCVRSLQNLSKEMLNKELAKIESFKFKVFIVERSEEAVNVLNSSTSYAKKDIQRLKDVVSESKLLNYEKEWNNSLFGPNKRYLSNRSTETNTFTSEESVNSRALSGIVCGFLNPNAARMSSRFTSVFDPNPRLGIDIEKMNYDILTMPYMKWILTKNHMAFGKAASILYAAADITRKKVKKEILDKNGSYYKDFYKKYEKYFQRNEEREYVDEYLQHLLDNPEFAYHFAVETHKLFNKNGTIYNLVTNYPEIFYDGNVFNFSDGTKSKYKWRRNVDNLYENVRIIDKHRKDNDN